MLGRKSYISQILFVVLVILLAVPSAFAAGQQDSSDDTDKVTEIKMSYNGPANVEENAVHFFAQNFKDLLAEKTGGSIEVILYPDSQLGDEEQRIQMVMNDPFINIASYGGVGTVFPELFAANIPFMFDSYAAGNWFFDNSEFWKKAQKDFLAKTGANLVCAVEEGGFLAFTNSKREIRKPSDFDGMKFRGMDDSQVALYNAFGASGTPIPWTELYTALQTGVVDGQMNPPMYIIMGSLYEVQEHMTLANIQYSMQYLTINDKWLQSLSEEDRNAVIESANEANALTRADVESRVEERTDFIADKGVKVYAPNDEEMQMFRDLGQPSFLKWLKNRIDGSWVDLAVESAETANKAVK